MSKSNGIVIYDGPSVIDGKPIVCIATGFARKSNNRKTGNLIQTWIMRSDIDPWQAKLSKKDKSVCGNCKHRDFATCYVELVRCGPCAIYKAYKAGSYPTLNDKNIDLFSGRKLRIGSYGDPSAVETKVWERLTNVVSSWTGYTHSWKNCDKKLKKWVMASTDTEKEAKEARSKGWRTFRILLPWEGKIAKNEFYCPAAKENSKTTCEKCLACGGKASKIKKHPVILAHGSFGKALRFEKIMRLQKNKKGWKHLVPKIFQ